MVIFGLVFVPIVFTVSLNLDRNTFIFSFKCVNTQAHLGYEKIAISIVLRVVDFFSRKGVYSK